MQRCWWKRGHTSPAACLTDESVGRLALRINQPSLAKKTAPESEQTWLGRA